MRQMDGKDDEYKSKKEREGKKVECEIWAVKYGINIYRLYVSGNVVLQYMEEMSEKNWQVESESEKSMDSMDMCVSNKKTTL